MKTAIFYMAKDNSRAACIAENIKLPFNDARNIVHFTNFIIS